MLSNVRVKNFWSGCYVGEGEYEGGTMNNTTFRNIDLDEDVEEQLLEKLRQKDIRDEGENYIDCSDVLYFEYEIVSTGETYTYSWGPIDECGLI